MSDRSIEASVGRLAEIMSALRVGCPWDQKQTHASLRRYLIEECHEVLEAIDAGDMAELRGELGDLLFQIWFHSEVASEKDSGFDLIDVLEGISDKLVRRHPHVFGEHEIAAKDLIGQWERIKLSEGRRSRMEGVPGMLPALLQAERFQEKAASAGFDWSDLGGVLDKIEEEVGELRAALADEAAGAGPEEVEAEFGDLLFTLVNYARHRGMTAEDSLRQANRRFRARFRHMEEAVAAENPPRDLADLEAAELESLWEAAKADLR